MEFEARRTRPQKFEEQEIKGYRLKLGAKTLDLDFPLLMDEKVEIVITGQVLGVHMDTNRTTGALIRNHVIVIDTITVREES